jgi:hypothetical protein
MEPSGGVHVKRHSCLISGLNGDEWSVSHPGHFISEEIHPVLIQ